MSAEPRSQMIDQLDGQWETLLTLVVWKLAKAGVTVSLEDLMKFAEENARGESMLLTLGRHTTVEFKIVTRAEAELIAAAERQRERPS